MTAVVTKVTPEAVSITTVVIPAPVKAVLSVPVTVTPETVWETVPPTLSVISCEAISNVHSFDIVDFNVPVLDPCVTVAPAFSVIACAVMSNFHSFCVTVAPTLSVIDCDVISTVHSLAVPT